VRKNGFVLVISIFIVIIFSVLGVISASLISGEGDAYINDLKGIQALHLAEAGIRYAFSADLASDSDWSDNSGFSRALYPGSFIIAYNPSAAGDTVTVEATGVVGNVRRKVAVVIKRGKLEYNTAFTHAIFVGNPTGVLEIQNDAHVIGDLYYNGYVKVLNQATVGTNIDGTIVNGTLFSDGYDKDPGAKVGSWEAAPDIQMPSFDSSYYDNLLLASTSVSTSESLVVSGNGSWTMNGGTYYYKNVIFTDNAKIYGSGTIVATEGDIVVNGNGKFFNDNVTLIAKGEIKLEGNTQLQKNCNLFSYDGIIMRDQTIVNEGVVFYVKNGNLEFNDDGHFYGSTLVPNGEIILPNHIELKGLIYGKYIEDISDVAHINGSICISDLGSISNQSIVTYDYDYLPAVIPRGLGEVTGSSESEVSNWYEVF